MRYTKPFAALLIISLPLAYFLTGASDRPDSEISRIESNKQTTTAPKKTLLPPPMLQRPASVLTPIQQASTTLIYESDADSNDALNHDQVRPIDRINAIKNKTALHQSVLQDHQQHMRYPSSNIAIAKDNKDPIAQRYEIDERMTENQDKTASLTIWTDKKFYQRGEQVRLSAKLLDAYGVPISTRFSTQLIFDEREGVAILDLRDDDNDGIHQVSFSTDQINDAQLSAGTYKLLVVNSAEELADAAVFTLTDPVAAFTGQYRDSLTKDGHLRIEAELDVSQKEKLYFQASLYTELGEAIGVSQNTFTFKPGKHWVPIEFYGLMLHDSGTDGPYLLKNISLARVTMPMQRGPLLTPEYYTQPYERSQFSSVPNDRLASN